MILQLFSFSHQVSILNNYTACLLKLPNTGPFPPTGFNLTRTFHSATNSTFTLEWDVTTQDGNVVDSFIISISYALMSLPARNVIFSPPWNITLVHNIIYTLSLTAMNCAGESKPTVLPEILISKCILIFRNLHAY